ncbi:MAG: LLM class flavin-dependent oxidoreductase [Micromonosporaceae bacterium]|nr:LLM class flavin-dependent oxidoreductase [Micromonosporaceae bacterium]
MKIGVGLPNPVPGTRGPAILEFARRAEQRGFHGVATIDRVAYPNHDTLATLAAVAGATSRIQLLSNVLLAPLYPPPLLAKSAASIDQLSGGRFTLGVAPGGRADDFAVVGRDMQRRGREMDEALGYLHRAWRGELFGDGKPICPPPTNGDRVPVLIGGGSDAAVRRTVEWGAGWTAGGIPPAMAGPFMQQVRVAWEQAGRAGEPRLAALAYFALGDDAAADSRAYLNDYYAFLGPYGEQIAEGALRSPAAIRDSVAAFTDVGCTELYLDATTSSPDQVDRLADVVL